ncbi:MAG: LuxR C-terminal-related transcriptional regulator [Candidatus Gastranaerophilales bacterium]|nr:LuxR C-terminal-related transcriptional regulator [Candidatus Gastranaerophilales bacterium]
MLTSREKEVLYYICKGYNNVEIGNLLHISKHTAKAHVCAILQKINARNRVCAAYLSGKLSYIEDND